MRTRAALALLLLFAATGCRRRIPELTHEQKLSVDGGVFVLSFADGDEASTARVVEALTKAAPLFRRWGALREPVQVRVLPDHDLLEEAVDRKGFRWLRAWARYDEVLVQSPRTWGLFGASQAEVDELILHELTHCVMYQSAASRTSWRRKEIPLWFREGMASVTANQGYRWPDRAVLARFFDEHPGEDPLTHPERLYQAESGLVYGAAHHAFEGLLDEYGEAGIRAILDRMGRGASFPDAFFGVIGVRPKRYLELFREGLSRPRPKPQKPAGPPPGRLPPPPPDLDPHGGAPADEEAAPERAPGEPESPAEAPKESR